MDTHWFPWLFPMMAGLFAWGGTGVLLPILAHKGVLDRPNARSNHKAPVPRGGGLAMIVAAVCFMWAAGMDGRLALAALSLALVSFVDDLHGLSPAARFGAQALAVALTLPGMPPLPLPFLPIWLVALAAGFAWLWVVNLTNFMDGIDGISAVQAAMVSAGVVALYSLHAVPLGLSEQASVLAFAALGFLAYNWPPARLFMGDAGSVPLGFLTGYVLWMLAAGGQWVAALLLPAYYLTDATLTLLTRLWRKEKFWQAHSQHAYQQAARAGWTHGRIVARIACVNFLLSCLAMASTLPMMASWLLLIPGYGLTLLLFRHFLHARPVR